MSSPSPASEVSGRRWQGNRRSIANRQGAEAFLLLQASGHVAGRRNAGRAGARGSHRRRPPVAQRPSHSRRAGSTICAWASGMLPTKNQADLRLEAPAKRCSPTRGWPMLLIVGSRAGLPPLSPRTGRLSCSCPFTALHQFSPHKRGRRRPVSSRPQVNNQGRSLPLISDGQ